MRDDGTPEVQAAIRTAFPQIPDSVVRYFVRLMRKQNEKRGGA